MSRLVIVSNRVADMRKSAQSGGLAVGVADALRARGGIWFGWSGEIGENPDAEPVVDVVGKVRTIGMPLTAEDYADYYIGHANSVLWPLFHYRLDLVAYKPAFQEGYARVNARFANALAPNLKSDDLVWIHDYHLMALARELRQRGCGQKMGFFLHIPFPPPDILAAVPDHRDLVEALLAHDVIGFQTSADALNFRRCLREFGFTETVPDAVVEIGGRRVSIERHPIGIDADAFRKMAARTPGDVRIDAHQRRLLGQRQIIGIDRLDYSKGLPGRFEAFGRLLEKWPEMEKQVTFLQVAPPTREDVDAYADIRMELERLTGAINGRFSDFNWIPIRYIHRALARDRLAPLLRTSQVGLVTPLRDGMNLVAKEFVAAQDPDDPGVLVLSQFAGAAEDMAEALMVNPYDVDGMADAIHQALEMPLDERRERHAALLTRIREGSAARWLEGFLASLEGSADARDHARSLDASAA